MLMARLLTQNIKINQTKSGCFQKNKICLNNNNNNNSSNNSNNKHHNHNKMIILVQMNFMKRKKYKLKIKKKNICRLPQQ